MKNSELQSAKLSSSLRSLFENVSSRCEQSPEEIFNHAVRKTVRLMGAKAGNIRLYDASSKKLQLAASYGVSSRYRNYKYALDLYNSASGRVFTGQEAYISENLASNNFYYHPEYAAAEGIYSMICLPLTASGRKMGVFSVYFHEPREFSKEEVDFLSMLVNFLASSLANRMLEQEVGRSHFDLAKVLIKVMEEKDLYTRGHSERVREYAVKIGERLNLSEKDFRALSEFSILHDIGKVTIDSRILNKPGKLTAEEWDKIKEHPLIGERILHAVDGFSSSIPIIKHHHERLDGTGYPDGLKGDEIPLLARIVAVCDSFDAMVSRRSYRDALSVESARLELIENSGTQFDAEIVKIMVDLIGSGKIQIFFEEEPSFQFAGESGGFPALNAADVMGQLPGFS